MFRANARSAETPNLMVMIDYVDVLYVTVTRHRNQAPCLHRLRVHGSANQHLLTLLNDAGRRSHGRFRQLHHRPHERSLGRRPWSTDEDSGVDSNYVYARLQLRHR